MVASTRSRPRAWVTNVSWRSRRSATRSAASADTRRRTGPAAVEQEGVGVDARRHGRELGRGQDLAGAEARQVAVQRPVSGAGDGRRGGDPRAVHVEDLGGGGQAASTAADARLLAAPAPRRGGRERTGVDGPGRSPGAVRRACARGGARARAVPTAVVCRSRAPTTRGRPRPRRGAWESPRSSTGQPAVPVDQRLPDEEHDDARQPQEGAERQRMLGRPSARDDEARPDDRAQHGRRRGRSGACAPSRGTRPASRPASSPSVPGLPGRGCGDRRRQSPRTRGTRRRPPTRSAGRPPIRRGQRSRSVRRRCRES